MAQNLEVCSVPEATKSVLDKFRFRKEQTNAAIIMKIDKGSMSIIIEDEMEDCSVEELMNELPEHQPRYVAFSYCFKQDDGRVSYPLCFVFCSPQAAHPELQMMYAGSKTTMVNACGFTKVYEIRSSEELTEEWLLQKLNLK